MYIAIRNYPPYKIGDEITEERYNSLSSTERRCFQKRRREERTETHTYYGGEEINQPSISGADSGSYTGDVGGSGHHSHDFGGGDGGGAGSSGSWGDSSSSSSDSGSSDSGGGDCGGGDGGGGCD